MNLKTRSKNAIAVEQSTLGGVRVEQDLFIQGSVTIKSLTEEAVPLLDFSNPTIRIIWPNGVTELEVQSTDAYFYQEGDQESRLPLESFLQSGAGEFPPKTKLVLRFSRKAPPELFDSLKGSRHVQIQVGLPVIEDVLDRPACMLDTRRFYTGPSRASNLVGIRLFEEREIETKSGKYSVLVPSDSAGSAGTFDAPPEAPTPNAPFDATFSESFWPTEAKRENAPSEAPTPQGPLPTEAATSGEAPPAPRAEE